MPRLGSSLEIYGRLLDVRSSVIRDFFFLDQQGCSSSHRRLTLSDSWSIKKKKKKSGVDQRILSSNSWFLLSPYLFLYWKRRLGNNNQSKKSVVNRYWKWYSTHCPHTLVAPKDWWEQPAGYKDPPTQINTQSIKDAIGLLAWSCVSSAGRKKKKERKKTGPHENSRASKHLRHLLFCHFISHKFKKWICVKSVKIKQSDFRGMLSK